MCGGGVYNRLIRLTFGSVSQCLDLEGPFPIDLAGIGKVRLGQFTLDIMSPRGTLCHRRVSKRELMMRWFSQTARRQAVMFVCQTVLIAACCVT